MAAVATMSQRQALHQPQLQSPQQQVALTDLDKLRQALSLKNIQQRCETTLSVLAAASSKEDFPSLVRSEGDKKNEYDSSKYLYRSAINKRDCQQFAWLQFQVVI